MTKIIYDIRTEPNAKGYYFDTLKADDDYQPQAPFIDKPIPEDIMAGIPRYDWSKAKWVDVSDEYNLSELERLNKENKVLKTSVAGLILEVNKIKKEGSK